MLQSQQDAAMHILSHTSEHLKFHEKYQQITLVNIIISRKLLRNPNCQLSKHTFDYSAESEP